MSYSYDIPTPSGNFWNNQFFKGWSVSGIVTYQSGLPFSVTDSTSGGAFGQTGGGTASFSGACGTDPSTMYTQGSRSDIAGPLSEPSMLQNFDAWSRMVVLELPVSVTCHVTRSVVLTSRTGTSH